MTEKRSRSPQEKKALSLKKDRRNTFGENQKASRKAIPKRKALESRRNRHKNNQALSLVEQFDEAVLDLVESSARQDIYRTGGWTKAPDEPLEKVIAKTKNARERRAGRKAARLA